MEISDLIKTPKLDGVFLHGMQHATVEGTLCISSHHLLLSARQEHSQELWLLHKNIDYVEKKPFMVQNIVMGGFITLKCKDLRIVSLEIRYAKEFYNVVASLEALCALHNTELEFPFFYRPMYSILEDGYTMFSLELEFAKLLAAGQSTNSAIKMQNNEQLTSIKTNGCLPTANSHTNVPILTLPASMTVLSNNDTHPLADCTTVPVGNSVGSAGVCEWRVSYINKDFTVCASYGATLIVPKCITDEQIVQSAAYRDGGRFPVLSYRHANGASLMRSAQPMSIQGLKRCRADEDILNIVLGRSKKGFIVDTWGKGKSNTETDQHYSQWKKVNRAIGNVSTPSSILDSFSKLMDACNDTNCTSDKWLSRLENSNWLNLVLNSLNAACIVAQCLDQEGCPVLVHGSKGLDSTLIVTSLVQIILNPDCRTVRGIQALIEREWIQAGHPFAMRHRHSCYTPAAHRNKNSGASFVLFLDCVHQLHTQFPCSFEFGTQLLVLLFEHSYFSQYGTFLCDSERERRDLRVHQRTTSLWSYLNRPDVLKNLLNPLYEPNAHVIWPSVAPISIELWHELYLRWIIDQRNTSHGMVEVQSLITVEKELRSKVIKLRKQVYDLTNEMTTLMNADM